MLVTTGVDLDGLALVIVGQSQHYVVSAAVPIGTNKVIY